MKLFSIVLLLLITSICYSQTITDKNFNYRNGFQEAKYNGKDGQVGNSGLGHFLQVLFHLSKYGGNGTAGKPGPALQVNVSGIPSGDSTILFITIRKSGSKKTDNYFVNPGYGKISIAANGGNGGDGGNGEDGREVTENRPNGGVGGNGGNGGDGGAGGTILVNFDSTAIAYVKCPCIIYHNDGGLKGKGGKGGKSPGAAGGEGFPGNDGEPGSSDPRIFIKGPDGKILWIAKSFER